MTSKSPQMPRARRWRRALAIGTLLALVVATAALSTLYSQSKEEFVAGALSRYLGRYVEIGKIDIRAETELRVLIENARVYPGPEKSGEAILELAQARGSQPWSRILVGNLVPHSWVVRSLRARLLLGQGGGDFDLRAIPSLALSLTDGQVSLAFGEDQLIELADLELTTRRSALLRELSGDMRGRISWNGKGLGVFEADVSGYDDEQVFGCQFSGIELSAIPASEDLPLEGLAEGQLRLRVSRQKITGSLEADVAGFSLQPPKYRAPIAPEDLQVKLDFNWDGDRLRLKPDPLLADELEITGQLDLSFGEEGRVLGDLAAAPFEPGLPAGGRFEVMRFLALRLRLWERIEKRFEAGRVVDGRIAIDIALADLKDALTMRSRTRPGELRYSARVENGIYRPNPDAAPLNDLRGSFSIDADRLEIRDLSFVRGATRIPDLDITVDGVRRLIRLPKNENKIKRLKPPTPGLGALFSSLRGDGGDALTVNFSHAQLQYPAFLLPIRDARGVFSTGPGLIAIETDSVIVGGVPGQLSVRWQLDAKRVSIDLRYDPEATAASAPSAPSADSGESGESAEEWFAADLFLDSIALGKLPIEDLAGRIHAKEDVLEFLDARGRLNAGSLRTAGRFSLSEPGRVPFDLTLGVEDADPAVLLEALGRNPDEITGKLRFDAKFEGELRPDTAFFEAVDLDMNVHVSEGEVSSELPAFVQVLRLPSLRGIAGLLGSNLPYDELSADFELRDLILQTKNMTLKGPELQAHAHGSMNLAPDPNDCDIVIEFLLVPSVDRLIDRVPIVGGMVLGENESLVVFGVQLRGDCSDPSARAMAPGSIETATAWARDLIGSGAGQLRRIILGPQEEEERDGESPRQDSGP